MRTSLWGRNKARIKKSEEIVELCYFWANRKLYSSNIICLETYTLTSITRKFEKGISKRSKLMPMIVIWV